MIPLFPREHSLDDDLSPPWPWIPGLNSNPVNRQDQIAAGPSESQVGISEESLMHLEPDNPYNPPGTPRPSWFSNIKADWPRGSIPVEIFENISLYLSRHELTCLRLVCREFEDKVSPIYFRNVVVPFRSNLYATITADENGDVRRPADTVMSGGMRIFQSFGRHISRFALSLELDEKALTYPPIKLSQKAVPAFWGIYRWPHGTYRRYDNLKVLEQTADETAAMRQALSCLTRVNELGLCCDAGLGYLLGPEGSRSPKGPVLAETGDRDGGRLIESGGGRDDENASIQQQLQTDTASYNGTMLECMVTQLGYRGPQIQEAIQMILDTENTTLNRIRFDEQRLRTMEPDDDSLQLTVQQQRRRARDHSPMMNLEDLATTGRYPLIPVCLTRAQKEMLLESEWAHRAMVQSFVIGIIDNTADGAFKHLKSLKISKIPSSHVYLFNHRELWQNLPSLTHVQLGVIPDWRRMQQSAPGCIKDTPILPSEAVAKVFPLLNCCIGAQRNIKHLHFEWVGGGEFAPGSLQRNNYILPAPIFPNPAWMVERQSIELHGEEILQLPHITHLSLRNCWSVPHVFVRFLHNMSQSSLENLELESFSLSGPPVVDNPPLFPFQPNFMDPQAFSVGVENGIVPAGFPPVFYTMPANIGPTTGPRPYAASWPCIIETFNPSVKKNNTLAETTADGGSLEASGATPQPQGHAPQSSNIFPRCESCKLRSLSFKSCGYVSVEHPGVNTRAILPTISSRPVLSFSRGFNEDINSMAQKPLDSLLARIAPYVKDHEVIALVEGFGMEFGWSNVYDEDTCNKAKQDGLDPPGEGRFSGVLKGEVSYPGMYNMD